jgi:hypothetical protein
MNWIELSIIGICTPALVFLVIIYRDFLNWRKRERGEAYFITIIDRNLHRLKVSPKMLVELIERGEVLIAFIGKRITFPTLAAARKHA